MTHTETELKQQRWMDWAIDRWLELDKSSQEARELFKQIRLEQWRHLIRGRPRRLYRSDVLRRVDPNLIRQRIWLQARRQLRRMQLASVQHRGRNE